MEHIVSFYNTIYSSANSIENCTCFIYNASTGAIMTKSLKKSFYQLSENEFKKQLRSIKENPNTIHFFNTMKQSYYYLHDEDTYQSILLLHKDQWYFDQLFNSFTEFGKGQIIQDLLIDEIQSTNSIENIKSTRHDVFYLINHLSKSQDKKIVFITNGYSLLLNNAIKPITSLKELRKRYDDLLMGTLESKDLPDGKLFRKGSVYITDGLKSIHKGFYPEEEIIEGMEEVLKLYHSKMDIYEKNILAHFLLETIHPFYDGNGRLGRYLFSESLYKETNSYLSFSIAFAINQNKAKYYKALRDARDLHEFGCLNQYMINFSNLLHTGFQSTIQKLEKKKKDMNAYYEKSYTFTKAEREVYRLLVEGTILSEFGVSNEEIMNYTNLSKRTIINSLNKMREMKLIKDHRIGKYIFHQLDI